MKFERDEKIIQKEIDNGSDIQCVKDCRFYMGRNICSILTDNEDGVRKKCKFHKSLDPKNSKKKEQPS